MLCLFYNVEHCYSDTQFINRYYYWYWSSCTDVVVGDVSESVFRECSSHNAICVMFNLVTKKIHNLLSASVNYIFSIYARFSH